MSFEPAMQIVRRTSLPDPEDLATINGHHVTVHLPIRMKDDLMRSASDAVVPLSVHIREVLTSELLGRLYLRDRAQFSRIEAIEDDAVFDPI